MEVGHARCVFLMSHRKHKKHGKGFVDEALGVVATLKIIKKSDQKSFKIINDGTIFSRLIYSSSERIKVLFLLEELMKTSFQYSS